MAEHDVNVAQGEAAQQISLMRREIDVADDEVMAVLLRRRMLSRQIQAVRARVGGPVQDLDREQALVARYVSILGGAGAHVAGAILVLCSASPTGDNEHQ